jgi:hypothetical protein
MRLHVLSADFKDRNKELKGNVLSVEDIYGAAYLHEKMAVYHAAPFPLDAAIKDTASVKVKIQQEAHKRQGGGAGGAVKEAGPEVQIKIVIWPMQRTSRIGYVKSVTIFSTSTRCFDR